MQTCIWPNWCHCHSLSLASVKSTLVLPFWYQLTRVVPEKGPLNVCVCLTYCRLWRKTLLDPSGTFSWSEIHAVDIPRLLCVKMPQGTGVVTSGVRDPYRGSNQSNAPSTRSLIVHEVDRCQPVTVVSAFSFSSLTLLVWVTKPAPVLKLQKKEVENASLPFFPFLPSFSIFSVYFPHAQIVCIWSSWCHCHPKAPLSLAWTKSRVVLPFWYRLTQVVVVPSCFPEFAFPPKSSYTAWRALYTG